MRFMIVTILKHIESLEYEWVCVCATYGEFMWTVHKYLANLNNIDGSSRNERQPIFD